MIVSTKLDTKIPQFARASDVEVFLSPPASTLDGFILGVTPFFTSVPSGRVGVGGDSVYRSNDEFKEVSSMHIHCYVNVCTGVYQINIPYLGYNYERER